MDEETRQAIEISKLTTNMSEEEQIKLAMEYSEKETRKPKISNREFEMMAMDTKGFQSFMKTTSLQPETTQKPEEADKEYLAALEISKEYEKLELEKKKHHEEMEKREIEHALKISEEAKLAQ
mmetsp:Transcript_11250/g.18941  ORF Transcript_11250/g.18941 Transcript_11250/m.18941 type:complete len:123 (+) Transcript_11250:147-515(+)